MPRGGATSGTRYGNGAGYGGPANGTRTFATQPQPPGVAKSVGKIEGGLEREAYIERLRAKLAIAEEVYDRATAPNAPIMGQLKAVEQMENRVYGAAKQTLEVQRDNRTDAEILASIKAKQKALGIEPG